jgi:hypothetical protein
VRSAWARSSAAAWPAHHDLGIGHGDGERARGFELRQNRWEDLPPHPRHVVFHNREERVVVGVGEVGHLPN